MTTCMMTHPPARCTLPVGHDGPHATRDGYGWHDSDDMGGGVTAALIEKETEKPDPSVDYHAMWWKAEREREKAEQERDKTTAQLHDALDEQAKLIKERDEVARALGEALESHDETLRAIAEGKYAAESRPLTPRQNLAALWESAHRPVGGRIPAGTAIITRSDYGSGDVRYQTLEATGRDLPDPGYTLERNYNYGPENGEEYRLLDLPTRPEGAEELQRAMADLEMDDPAGFADLLAERGVRVVGEEQS